MKELECIFNPIIAKIYQVTGDDMDGEMHEAENYMAQDNEQYKNVEAKAALKNCAYYMRYKIRGVRVIILYSGSTLNAYSLLSQKLWVPLIKFMMRPTTSVRGGSTHLMYSRST
jgi:hypothetical protein